MNQTRKKPRKPKQKACYSHPYSKESCGAGAYGYQRDDIGLAADSRPGAVAMTPDGRALYVVNADGTLSIIDAASTAVIATLPTGSNPLGIAMHPTNDRAYVANFDDRTISVYNTASDSAVGAPISVQTGPTEIQPASLAVSSDGTRLFVNSDTWFAQGGLAWIDLATNATQIIEPPSMFVSGLAGVKFPRNPYGTAITSADPQKFFATQRMNLGDRAIRVADSAGNTFMSFEVDLLPCALIARGDELIVSGYKSDGPGAEDLGIDIFRQSDLQHLRHIDVPGIADQLLPGEPIPIEGYGYSLRAIALDPACGELWYGNTSDPKAIGHVGIVNLDNGQFRTLAIEDCNGIAFTPDGRFVFLSDSRNHRVIRFRLR